MQLQDAHRLGNAGHINGLGQDGLSCLSHVYKNTLNYLFFYCCFNLPVSLVYIKRLDAGQHLESGSGMLTWVVVNRLTRQDYHYTIWSRTKACFPCVLKEK